jgi:hypothetical protein
MSKSVDPVSPSARRPVPPFTESSDGAAALNFAPHLSSSVKESDTPQPAEPSVPESNLRNFQDQLKNAMIPLLIDIFALKEAAIQARNPPTRLQNQPELSAQTVEHRLLELEKSLQMAELWNQTCLTQIRKALEEVRELAKGSAKSFSACEMPVDSKSWRAFSADLAKKLFKS